MIRKVAGAGIGALALIGASVVAPPASAAEVPLKIGMSAFDRYEVSIAAQSGFAGLTADEFIEVSQVSNGLVVFSVRKDTAVDTTFGRPLLHAGPDDSCFPTGINTVEIRCSTGTGSPFIDFRADMTLVSGYMQLVMMQTDVDSPMRLTYRGGSGTDEVYAAQGNDSLLGGAGDDRLFGGAGDDLINGGPGNDSIEGESGRDDMRGGSGRNSIDAADGVADTRVDCGGVPEFLDFDAGKDVPVNCTDAPVPEPPAPTPPADSPAPGEGNGEVDGVPTTVDVPQPQNSDDPVVGSVQTPTGSMLFNSGLWWFGTPSQPQVPTFPTTILPGQLLPAFNFDWASLLPQSELGLWAFPFNPPGVPTMSPTMSRARPSPISSQSNGIALATLQVNSQGKAQGTVPVPQGQSAGDYVLQVNGVTADGAAFTVNLGVALTEATPAPDPEPEESIAIASAKRGKGKKAAIITVRGTTVGLAEQSVTPRYRIRGKKWVTAAAVSVAANGNYRWRLKTNKSVRVVVISGAIRSDGVKVSAR
ncbi:MAG: hypothetical protein WAO41_00920 [Candidatus Nanopelagicales bacterium]